MVKKILVILGIIIILGLVITIFQKYSTPKQQSNDIVGYWFLSEFPNEENNQIPKDIKSATIAFEKSGKVSGVAFCNNYQGTYVIDGNNISFGPVATTQKACTGQSMTFETKYLTSLSNTTKYKIENDNLYLNNDKGKTLLLFKLRPEVSIENTDWNVVGYNNGPGVTTLIIGTEITANFSDGKVSGTTGCNTYNAAYALGDNNSIEIGIPAVTQVVCEEEIMQQEQEYLTALQNSTTYTMTFDGLELKDSGDNLQATFISK